MTSVAISARLYPVAFDRNGDGNAFWEKMGFSVRRDLVYRDRALTEMIRTDT